MSAVDPAGIEAVFRRNFEERGELGAALSVWRDGREILSLHGGWIDAERTRPWAPETPVPVWSATKGPAAAATLLALHEAGLSPETPVAEVWPELLAARDGRLRFAGLLSHQSGLPALAPENRGSMLSHASVREGLERQEPFWKPREGHGYHPRTIGFLLDEVVRRVAGMPLGVFWRERIARPLGLDFRIGGLPSEWAEGLARIRPPQVQRPPREEVPFYRALADPGSLSLAAFSSPGGMKALSDINKLEYLQAGLPSLGGAGTARALAGFYQLLAGDGALNGVRILPRALVRAARTPCAAGLDRVLLLPTSFTAGFMRDPLQSGGGKLRRIFGPSPEALGQPGAGGSLAFADPASGISFAYVMNQMETGLLPNRKALDLVEALYGALRRA